MSDLRQDHISILNKFRDIYLTYPYSTGDHEFPRIEHLTPSDEIVIESIYKDWRGENVDFHCDECLNEAFDRLMKAMIEQETAV